MILYNIYRDYCPEVVEVWHPDLKRILKRYADVTYVTKKQKKARKLWRRKVYDYHCEFDGTVYNDGSFDECGWCDINYR